jgi:type VI secretion system secreted protein VgrG
MAFPQADRLIRMTTGPLSSEEVLLTGFSGQENISRLFTYQLDLVSTQLGLKPSQLVGKQLAFEIDRRTKDGQPLEPRFFHGYINRFHAGPVALHQTQRYQYRSYRIDIVPWLWFLTQTARCYIFFPEREEKSVYDIIQAVFDRARDELHVDPPHDLGGIADLKTRQLKHCVQYRETDFNFVSRIMEQFGVYYYFKHENGKHTLVLSQKKNYPPCPENEVTFPKLTGSQTQLYHITDWEHAYEFVSGEWEHTDYNFETPLVSLNSSSPKIAVDIAETANYEVYDFPGEFDVKSDSDAEARIRQEEEEGRYDMVNGSSLCATFAPGHTFKLISHPDEDESAVKQQEMKSYLITSVEHFAAQPGPESGESDATEYLNNFTCIPASLQFRPPRVTPKPAVSGIQTAVVVGPKGEEIYSDQYGRIKVCFHWDREGQQKKRNEGENCSCWIRVAQSVAGRNWGFMALPRIGQEVVVDFLEGDPDRPIVVGSVYNRDQMPHYNPKEDKTKTYIKTNSSKGGEGFNELMFEDKKDEERVFIHAEKNMDVRVKATSKARILGHRHQIIGTEKGGDQRELVWQDKHLNVKKNQVEKIEGNLELMVGGGDSGGNADILIGKQRTETIGEGSDLMIGGSRREQVGQNASLDVGGDQHTKVAKLSATEAGQEIHLKAGMKIVIEAGMQLTIKSAGGFVDIGPAGVTIQGTMVKINSGGAPGSGSGCRTDSPQQAKQAQPIEPDAAHNSSSGRKSSPE